MRSEVVVRLRSAETSPSGWKRRQHHLERMRKSISGCRTCLRGSHFEFSAEGCVVEFGVVGI